MGVFGNTIDTGSNVRNIVQTEECVVMQMADETGEGTMTAHLIFDGTYIMYNDFHMKSCTSEFKLTDNASFLVIDHCREGRIENEVKPGVFSFLQEKEMRIDNRKKHGGQVVFPLSHYHGITIGFDLRIAGTEIQKVFPGFSVDLGQLQKKYLSEDNPYVIRDEPGIEHILTISDSKVERPYFYKSQVEKIKAAHELVTKNLQRHYTTEELAKRFDISGTALKKGFREIYGDSLYSYVKRVRMNTAASMLKMEPDKSIGEIAGAVGYENQGKFSTAFKEMMGMPPLEYRKSV